MERRVQKNHREAEGVRRRVPRGKPVARNGKHPEELRRRVHKVQHLRDEEQEQGLGELAQDSSDRKRHPREIAERVAHKRSCRIPAVLDQGQHDGEQGQHHAQREEMKVLEVLGSVSHSEGERVRDAQGGEVKVDVEQVVADDQQTDGD